MQLYLVTMEIRYVEQFYAHVIETTNLVINQNRLYSSHQTFQISHDSIKQRSKSRPNGISKILTSI